MTVTVTYSETRPTPGARGFLGGGLPGAGLVVGVPRGLVPPGAALVDGAELGGVDLGLQGPGGLRGRNGRYWRLTRLG